MRKTRCGSESARAFLRGFACGISPLSRSEMRRDIINSMQSVSGLKDSFEAVGQYLHNAVGLMDAKVGREVPSRLFSGGSFCREGQTTGGL